MKIRWQFAELFIRFDNSGYIKNVAASQPTPGASTTLGLGGIARDQGDVGNDQYTGFRITTLWQPIESLEVTLAYTTQEIEQDGNPDVDLGLTGDYQQRRFGTGFEGSQRELLANDIDISNLVIDYDLGWGSFASSTSLINYSTAVKTDGTHFMKAFGPAFADNPYSFDTKTEHEVFIEELRLASNLNGPVQFVAGFYYEDRKKFASDFTYEWSGGSLEDPEHVIQIDINKSIEQKAFFGEINYAITDQWSATLGGRHFEYDGLQVQETTFFSARPDRITVQDDSGQNYKANLTYVVNDDVFGLWSMGTRFWVG